MNTKNISKQSSPLTTGLFFAILALTSVVRLFGLNWDQNQHLHPDERFLTMVAANMKWTTSYFDTAISTLNPHNIGYGFYVYGTFPVILAKFIADSLSLGDYTNLTLIGRGVSVILDVGTAIVVYLIARRVSKNSVPGLLAMLAYSLSVLPIQLAHYFAVDTHLIFFITLSIYLLLSQRLALFGIAYGLAISSKISALTLLPVIGLFLVWTIIKSRQKIHTLASTILAITLCVSVVRVAYPYLFDGLKLNSLVVTNWEQLQSFNRPNIGYPPAVLWINLQKGLYPLENNIYWGLGVPLGLISLIAVFLTPIRHFRHPQILFIFFIVILISVYQGLQYAQPLRYFYPIYPFLAVLVGIFIYDLSQLFPRPSIFYSILTICLLVWPLAFISIYSRPHTRVTATDWILKNVPPGSSLACEHWDDCLPLGYHFPPYKGVEFPLYWPDNQEKWRYMVDALSKTDYIILSSNRLYGSLGTVPGLYPITNKYYSPLFAEKLGFKLVAQFVSRPNIPIPAIKLCLQPSNIWYGKIAASVQTCPNPGISFIDDYADEPYTVIDHPKVLIFKKVADVDYSSLLSQP